MLFEHDDIHALPGEEIAEHQPGRADASDADFAGKRFHLDLWNHLATAEPESPPTQQVTCGLDLRRGSAHSAAP